MDKNIFIITYFFFKNGMVGRGAQHISLCALKQGSICLGV